MPKETKAPMSHAAASAVAPYPQATSAIQRNAAIWSSADDEILLRARASGLNWQPIASKHFPKKSANACRKRHERLVERRHSEDWDHQKLELLAQEYLACRKEMWELLASRLGERWNVVEAKCMEKGIKTLQSTARTAQRKASLSHGHMAPDERGIADHNSDSGIVLSSGSEAEMDVDDGEPSGRFFERTFARTDAGTSGRHAASVSWSETFGASAHHLHNDYIRARSLPVPAPLPVYRPPIPRAARLEPQGVEEGQVHPPGSPTTASFEGPTFAGQRYSPGAQQRGISIQSVLAPAESRDGERQHRAAMRQDGEGSRGTSRR